MTLAADVVGSRSAAQLYHEIASRLDGPDLNVAIVTPQSRTERCVPIPERFARLRIGSRSCAARMSS